MIADENRAPGDAIDYAYGTADVRWSFSAELRDTGTVSLLLACCEYTFANIT